MARKKKQVEEEVPAVVGDLAAMSGTEQSLTQTASYQGGVQITLYRRKLPVASRRYKNQGGAPLFNFLARCLGGKYQEAEAFRPRYVQLFYVDPSAPAAEVLKRGDAVEKSSKVLYKSDPVIDDTDSSTPSAKTTLEFMLPFTQINTGGGDINLAALYAKNNDAQKDYCAFVSFDPNKTRPTSGDSADYNLFIQWDLKVLNK